MASLLLMGLSILIPLLMRLSIEYCKSIVNWGEYCKCIVNGGGGEYCKTIVNRVSLCKCIVNGVSIASPLLMGSSITRPLFLIGKTIVVA